MTLKQPVVNGSSWPADGHPLAIERLLSLHSNHTKCAAATGEPHFSPVTVADPARHRPSLSGTAGRVHRPATSLLQWPQGDLVTPCAQRCGSNAKTEGHQIRQRLLGCASLLRGVDVGVKTLYSPPNFDDPSFRAKAFLNRGTDHESRQCHQDTPARPGFGCVRACRPGACLEWIRHAHEHPRFVRAGQPLLAGPGRGPGASGRRKRIAHPS